MSNQLQQTVTTVRQLSFTEQLELLKLIFENLLAQPRTKHQLIDLTTQLLRDAFYSTEQPAPQQPMSDSRTATRTVDAVTADFWPPDESVDEFLAFTQQQRQESLVQ